MIQIASRSTRAVNRGLTGEVHVVVCTTGNRHLLDQLGVDRQLYLHLPTDCPPMMLGFQCQSVLRDRWGSYDYYCYLEDDLILHDPWLFAKLAWFDRLAGSDKLLQPNRFELGSRPLVMKAYVDGDLRAEVTLPFQNTDEDPRVAAEFMGNQILFRRPQNPHSGCFFLNAVQMQHWMNQPYFGQHETSFIGPLESAATLGIMRTMKIYKPAPENASFLEIEHFGTQFISKLRPADPPAQ